MRLPPFALALVCLVACTNELPEEDLIDGLRVLAVRPTSVADPSLAEFSPGDDVLLEALIVDSEGVVDPLRLGATWLACPSPPRLGTFDCIEPLLPQPTPQPCPAQADSYPPLCVLAQGLSPTITVPSFPEAAQGVDLALVMVVGETEVTPVEECLASFLAGDHDTPDGCYYVGYRLGVAGDPPGQPDQEANTHPVLETVQVIVEGRDPVSVSTDTTWPASADEIVELQAVFSADSGQTYWQSVNGEVYAEAIEQLSVSWYRTAGTFESALGMGMDVLDPGQTSKMWRAEPGTSRIYAVARDQRGGVTWWWSDAVVP